MFFMCLTLGMCTLTYLDITFPAEFVGVKTEVATIALIVPDIKSHTQHLVLVGTNTLDALYEEHFIKLY